MFDLFEIHKLAPVKEKPKRKRREPEALEQKDLIRWANRTRIAGYLVGEYLTHVPNEGKRGPKAARDFKELGSSPGYPDLILDIAAGGYHGLRIEMKAPKDGRVRDNQKAWHRRLNRQGYLTVVCNSSPEAQQLITDYLTGMNNEQN